MRSTRSPHAYPHLIRTFLYLHARDFDAARNFYSTLLELEEIHASPVDGVVGYRIGSLQLTISRHDSAGSADGWARQLGWSGGSQTNPSWGIEYPYETFTRVVARIADTDTVAFTTEPTWVGYWSLPVRDPMGNTVEISSPGTGAEPA